MVIKSVSLYASTNGSGSPAKFIDSFSCRFLFLGCGMEERV